MIVIFGLWDITGLFAGWRSSRFSLLAVNATFSPLDSPECDPGVKFPKTLHTTSGVHFHNKLSQSDIYEQNSLNLQPRDIFQDVLFTVQ